QPRAAAQDPRHEAGHAHRHELVQHGRLGGRSDRDRGRRLHQLVHGDALDRPGEGAGSMGEAHGELKLTQSFQKVSGALGTQAISEGKLRGDELTFKVGNTTYTGKVNGTTIQGSGWTATKKS